MKKAEAAADVSAHSGAADQPAGALSRTASVNVQDGLRVDWPDRWFHVRVSQTEPIRPRDLRAEGASRRSAVRSADGRSKGFA